MEETRLEDLVVINYRQQGVADKIVKAHSTVLAKRIKYRVRSEKVFGWIYVIGEISLGCFLEKLA
jgi:hypothetical protein